MSPLPYGPDVGTRILRRCDELALISAPSKGVTRLYLTPEHRRAADLVIDWMTDAGMEAYMDAVGNVVGRYDSEGGKGPYLILGSHFDTVVDGGKYDGALGVVTPVAVYHSVSRWWLSAMRKAPVFRPPLPAAAVSSASSGMSWRLRSIRTASGSPMP
jgi:hypothetical protein